MGLDQMTSIAVLCTAIKARFLHANSDLIHHCKNLLFNSIDALKLSEIRQCARSFWDNSPLVLNILDGARGNHLLSDDDSSDDLAEFIAHAVDNSDGKPQRA
eukprot:5881423-Karenia_brevis.AAC.1